MNPVLDRFGNEIDIDSLVAISTNSGMYVGVVTKFNYAKDYRDNDYLSSVQVKLTTGRKQSYDIPDRRMINLDKIHYAHDVMNLTGRYP